MSTPAISLRHYRRVHRVVNYISQNIDGELDLDIIAKFAGLSPFHFHRLFRAVMGEPVFQFVRRQRLEVGATLLHGQSGLPVGQVAMECGFRWQAAFARAFHEHFGRTPTEWREGKFWRHNGRHLEWRPIGHIGAKPAADQDTEPLGEIGAPSLSMIAEAGNGKQWGCVRKVELAKLPGFRVAYLRQLGPYDPKHILRLWQQLLFWLDRAGMLTRDSIGIGVPQDNDNVVAPWHCRYDAGIVVDADCELEDVLDVRDVSAGTYVVADFSGRMCEEVLASEYLWGHWLPRHGYEQNYGYVLRRFRLMDLKDRLRAGDVIFNYQLCIPIKRIGYPLVKPEVIIEPFR